MKAKYTRFTTEQILQCRQNNFMMEELIKNTEGLVYKIARKFNIKDMEKYIRQYIHIRKILEQIFIHMLPNVL